MAQGKSHRMFWTLNGPVLDDRKAAFAGLAIIDYFPDDTWRLVDARFYDCAAGAHAAQVNKEGTRGYLGSFANTPILFDPKDGNELRMANGERFQPMDGSERLSAAYHGPTHAVWLSDTEFIAAVNDNFYQFDLNRPGWRENLGSHGVPWPHAMKLSASGRYIFYGTLDYPDGYPARRVGVFDRQQENHGKRARKINLPITAWHVAAHPTDDVFYAVSERYLSGPGGGNNPNDDFAIAIEFGVNYAWKFDGLTARILKTMAFPAHYPSHLSADVIALGDDKDTILANCCASGTNAIISFADYSVRYIDEKVNLGTRKNFGRKQGGKTPGRWQLLRNQMQNILDAACIAHLPGNTHILLQAIRATNGNMVEGPFGLSVNAEHTRLFSAHRGLNSILVYDFTKPDLPLIKIIHLPRAHELLSKKLGLAKELGLGGHHMTSLTH